MPVDNIPKAAAVIPARMASSRFPGKPLALLCSLSIVEHVRRRTIMCSDFNQVLVATCDQEIMDHVQEAGGQAMMTSPTHPGCLDRVAEAAGRLDEDIVVCVQGDMPLVRPDMLADLVRPLREDPSLMCTDLVGPITQEAEYQSPNVVKTVADLQGNALYYSREPIPSRQKARKELVLPLCKQFGVIAFRRDFLLSYASWPRSPLEDIESIDILRVLEHGYKVRLVSTPHPVVGVDTPQDLENAEALMRHDDLYPRYA